MRTKSSLTATQPLSDVVPWVNVLRKSKGLTPDALIGLVKGDHTLSDPVASAFQQAKGRALLTFGFLQPVDVPDIRMVQRREDFGFPLKAGQSIRIIREGLRQDLQRHVRIIREGLRQDLQRHVPVELGVRTVLGLREVGEADLTLFTVTIVGLDIFEKAFLKTSPLFTLPMRRPPPTVL